MKSSDLFLYLVTLGGKFNKTHIEMHDIRWVIGNTIEDTFPQLRKEWKGIKKGLHIDSYVKILYVDGYRINFSKDKSKPRDGIRDENLLWFINLGGYSPDSLFELHEATLIVAPSRAIAKETAYNKLLLNAEKKHNDNIYGIQSLEFMDSFHLGESIDNWQITLSKDPKGRSQSLKPDWFGYLRIDNIYQDEFDIL